MVIYFNLTNSWVMAWSSDEWAYYCVTSVSQLACQSVGCRSWFVDKRTSSAESNTNAAPLAGAWLRGRRPNCASCRLIQSLSGRTTNCSWCLLDARSNSRQDSAPYARRPPKRISLQSLRPIYLTQIVHLSCSSTVSWATAD